MLDVAEVHKARYSADAKQNMNASLSASQLMQRSVIMQQLKSSEVRLLRGKIAVAAAYYLREAF